MPQVRFNVVLCHRSTRTRWRARACELLLVAASTIPAVAAASIPVHEAFAQLVEEKLSDSGIPGGAFAIVADGKIVHARGVGVRGVNDPRPVTEDTVFRIASVSKTFAAQLASLYVQEGQLRWDDPVSLTVPEIAFKSSSHTQSLQLQHLLSHSTGIVSNAYDNLLEANQPIDRILPQFRSLDALCAPGTCYTYQNILFSLVAPMIERRIGRTYEELVQERLLGPLGMTGTSFGLQAFLDAPNRALPHARAGEKWVPAPLESSYYQVAPAAGVNATAADLARWLLAQLGENPTVVPSETTRSLTTARVRTTRHLRRHGWEDMLSDAHYGLGWRIYRLRNEEIYLHGGWTKGFVAEIAYSPRLRTGVVVLLNAESRVLGELSGAFWKLALAQAATAHTGSSTGSPRSAH